MNPSTSFLKLKIRSCKPESKSQKNKLLQELSSDSNQQTHWKSHTEVEFQPQLIYEPSIETNDESGASGMEDFTMPAPNPSRTIESASEFDLKEKEVNEPMNGSQFSGMEDFIIPPRKPVSMKVEKEEAPKYTLSNTLQQPKKSLEKKFTKYPDTDRTATVQVIINDLPVDMVIDCSCFDSIITHHQWKQLGEPKLEAVTREDWVSFRRTSSVYKNQNRWRELDGYFNTMVKIEDCVSVIMPIYVWKAKRTINFLGRWLYYDLGLNMVNAHLIRVTEAVVPVYLISKLENSTAEQHPDAVSTEDSGVEIETTAGDEDGFKPEAKSVTENTDVPTAYEETEDKVADSITALHVSIDKTKEKNKVKREKYEKRMAELVPKLAELEKLVGLESTEKTSELNVPQSEHYANAVALKKAVSQLKSIYKEDHKKADKVLRGATVELTALKKEIARTSLKTRWIKPGNDVERKEQALEAVADQIEDDFEEKMTTLSDAKGVLPKFAPATKVKYFFKSHFGPKQKNVLFLALIPFC